MDTTGPYSLAQIQGTTTDALRIQAATVSFRLPLPSRHPGVISQRLPKPLQILQSFQCKSPAYRLSLEALTVSSTVSVHQVATLTLLVSPLHSWCRTRSSNHSQSFHLGKLPIIRYTTG